MSAVITFPDPGEPIPYYDLSPEQKHALHAWLIQHGIPPGRVPVYARFDLDAATREWRIPVYWLDERGRMRLEADGYTVRKHVVRRRELSPLPWPVYGPPIVKIGDVDVSEYVAGTRLGGDADDETVCCDPDCPCDDEPGQPIETIDTRGLL